ncbi:hypothetical protein MMC20_002460 [Loxospora ochrophaea]|nr:hypothetical protein [Loxospora ochrophaea]
MPYIKDHEGGISFSLKAYTNPTNSSNITYPSSYRIPSGSSGIAHPSGTFVLPSNEPAVTPPPACTPGCRVDVNDAGIVWAQSTTHSFQTALVEAGKTFALNNTPVVLDPLPRAAATKTILFDYNSMFNQELDCTTCANFTASSTVAGFPMTYPTPYVYFTDYTISCPSYSSVYNLSKAFGYAYAGNAEVEFANKSVVSGPIPQGFLDSPSCTVGSFRGIPTLQALLGTYAQTFLFHPAHLESSALGGLGPVEITPAPVAPASTTSIIPPTVTPAAPQPSSPKPASKTLGSAPSVGPPDSPSSASDTPNSGARPKIPVQEQSASGGLPAQSSAPLVPAQPTQQNTPTAPPDVAVPATTSEFALPVIENPASGPGEPAATPGVITPPVQTGDSPSPPAIAVPPVGSPENPASPQPPMQTTNVVVLQSTTNSIGAPVVSTISSQIVYQSTGASQSSSNAQPEPDQQLPASQPQVQNSPPSVVISQNAAGQPVTVNQPSQPSLQTVNVVQAVTATNAAGSVYTSMTTSAFVYQAPASPNSPASAILQNPQTTGVLVPVTTVNSLGSTIVTSSTSNLIFQSLPSPNSGSPNSPAESAPPGVITSSIMVGFTTTNAAGSLIISSSASPVLVVPSNAASPEVAALSQATSPFLFEPLATATPGYFSGPNGLVPVASAPLGAFTTSIVAPITTTNAQGSVITTSATIPVLAIPTLQETGVLVPITTTNAAGSIITASSTSDLVFEPLPTGIFASESVPPGAYTTSILIPITTINAAGSVFTTFSTAPVLAIPSGSFETTGVVEAVTTTNSAGSVITTLATSDIVFEPLPTGRFASESVPPGAFTTDIVVPFTTTNSAGNLVTEFSTEAVLEIPTGTKPTSASIPTSIIASALGGAANAISSASASSGSKNSTPTGAAAGGAVVCLGWLLATTAVVLGLLS